MLITAVLLLVVLCAGFYFFRQNNSEQSSPGVEPPGTEKIDLSPPTEEDKQAVDQHKEDLAKQPQSEPVGTSTREVKPSIVDAHQYDKEVEVRAFVAGVYEEVGVCKFTFTKGGSSLTKELAAEKDSSYMRCPTLLMASSEFSSGGEWSLVVSYNSATAQGSSNTKVTISP